MNNLRNWMLALMVAGGLPVIGCTQQPPAGPSPAPPKPPATTAPATPAAKGPSPTASAVATAPATSSPSSSASSPSTASPAATGSPVAKAPGKKDSWRRMEFEDAGIEFSVLKDFPAGNNWEKDLGDDKQWIAAANPDKSLVVLVRSKFPEGTKTEWEWDDMMKMGGGLLHDFKQVGKESEAKTQDGIPYWWGIGTAKIWDKPYVLGIAGYEMHEHNLIMIVAADANNPDLAGQRVEKIITTVTRQGKYQQAEDEKGEE